MRRAYTTLYLYGAAVVIGASLVVPAVWRELRKALT